MKSWVLADDIRSDRDLADAVRETRPVVEDVLGESSSQVDVRWSLAADPAGRPAVILNLSDWTQPGGVEARFRPDELGLSRDTWRRVHRLWGDLLQARNHWQLDQLIRAGG